MGERELVKVFNFADFEVRSVIKEGHPWFVAKDVCEILEIKDQRQSTRYLDDDEKGVFSTHTLGGLQNMTYVNEWVYIH